MENEILENSNQNENAFKETASADCSNEFEEVANHENMNAFEEVKNQESTEQMSDTQEQKNQDFERDELFEDENFCTKDDNGILEKNNLEETQEIKQDAENLTENTKLVSEFDNIKCDDKVGVYIKVNDAGFITDVSSDLFLDNLDGWIKIDEGDGDRFVHAQSSYFDSPLVDEFGNYLLKR